MMRDFPGEALVAAMELARVSPWAALIMALTTTTGASSVAT